MVAAGRTTQRFPALHFRLYFAPTAASPPRESAHLQPRWLFDPHRLPGIRMIALGWCLPPELPADTRWHPVKFPPMAFDHGPMWHPRPHPVDCQDVLYKHRIRFGLKRIRALNASIDLRRRTGLPGRRNQPVQWGTGPSQSHHPNRNHRAVQCSGAALYRLTSDLQLESADVRRTQPPASFWNLVAPAGNPGVPNLAGATPRAISESALIL